VNANSENLIKEPFILFLVNHPYQTMAVQERETYSKSGEIQLLTVQFMEGINKKSKIFRDNEIKEIEAFVKAIWERYTTNKNNHLGATGLKQMVETVTGIGNIEESRIQEFLIDIDEDKNGTIEREELSEFIQRGISMTAKEKEEYASRGELQDIMIAFFNGVDDAKDVFTENGREGLDQYFEDQSDGSLQTPEIIAYVSSIWNNFWRLQRSIALIFKILI
jgi:hypothetical protein